MRLSLVIVVMTLVGCASHSPAPTRTAEVHAANIATAEKAGYKVVSNGDRTIFCPTAAPTGSHMAPTCLSESEWESLRGLRHSTSPATHFTNQSPSPGSGAGH